MRAFNEPTVVSQLALNQTMLNQAGTEAMYSAKYVDNYLDSVENLPNDVQRHLTRIREIDLQYRGKHAWHDSDGAQMYVTNYYYYRSRISF